MFSLLFPQTPALIQTSTPSIILEQSEALSTIETLQWKNPGMSSPEERDQYLTVDQFRAVRDVYQHLVLTQKLEFAKQIMDLGSGSGNSTYQLYLKGNTECLFVGVDTTENTNYAELNYAPLAPNQNLIYQSAISPYDLPEAPNGLGWDIITALAFFSWIPVIKQPDVLKHINTLLAPGGEILARTQGVQDRPYRWATDEIMKLPEWTPYFENYVSAYEDQTAETFSQSLREAGFVEIEVYSSQDLLIFPDKESMVQYFLQWLPQLSAIQGNDKKDTRMLQKKFATQVIDRYCELEGCNGKKISLVFPYVSATAKKRTENLRVCVTKV